MPKVPAPTGDPDQPLKALIFDSHYDPYKGVIVYVRVIDGSIKAGTKIRFMATEAEFEVIEVGAFMPRMGIVGELAVGDVGFIVAGIKNVKDTRVGDTVTDAKKPAPEALPGYRRINPMVFCGLYPIETQDYNDLREALEKLELNDASLRYEPESSTALGFGFRCGFLGLLHMEIIQERIEREFNIPLITTAPSVMYRVTLTNGEVIEIDNPSNYPEVGKIEFVEEPYRQSGYHRSE